MLTRIKIPTNTINECTLYLLGFHYWPATCLHILECNREVRYAHWLIRYNPGLKPQITFVVHAFSTALLTYFAVNYFPHDHTYISSRVYINISCCGVILYFNVAFLVPQGLGVTYYSIWSILAFHPMLEYANIFLVGAFGWQRVVKSLIMRYISWATIVMEKQLAIDVFGLSAE